MAGGRAPEYLRLNARVLDVVAQVLAAAGVLKGKSCSCYPAVSPEVSLSGGTFIDLQMTEAHACGRLVTAPAWPAHPAWLAQFLQVLGTRIEP
jgi:protease I